jgi:hypothetical protein
VRPFDPVVYGALVSVRRVALALAKRCFERRRNEKKTPVHHQLYE